MEKIQKIKCNVESCKFQESALCTLEEIQVGHSNENVTEDKETLCESFECSKQKTETAYFEVSVFISPSLPFYYLS